MACDTVIAQIIFWSGPVRRYQPKASMIYL